MDKLTVQDIFSRFYPGYLEKYISSPEQEKASTCIRKYWIIFKVSMERSCV